MKNSALCIKAVPYQEIIDPRDTVEQLQLWQELLAVLEKYFTNSNTPINKKQVIKHYYTCSKLFQTFNSGFKKLNSTTEKQLSKIQEISIK
ncbi:hypothetical protein JZO78_13455 [Enterococcus ureilyticus]|uniref:hypothetical protein n=1 Tax=Enterococcus ureilyticus TaxID=1131292 RepID=UPI001A90DBE3|nr:hypothetical protein [Enterococcus ureilyticus]MBO0447336.1 hypothetical protein [Enterococcus ureilyticus]